MLTTFTAAFSIVFDQDTTSFMTSAFCIQENTSVHTSTLHYSRQSHSSSTHQFSLVLGDMWCNIRESMHWKTFLTHKCLHSEPFWTPSCPFQAFLYPTIPPKWLQSLDLLPENSRKVINCLSF